MKKGDERGRKERGGIIKKGERERDVRERKKIKTREGGGLRTLIKIQKIMLSHKNFKVMVSHLYIQLFRRVRKDSILADCCQ